MLNLSTAGEFAPNHVLKAIELLVYHSGIHGMVGGQLLDVTMPPQSCSLPEIEFIHIHKTGALILASVLIPACLSAIEQTRMERLKRYGEAVGLAFQITDDLLDAESHLTRTRQPKQTVKPSYNQMMSVTEMKEKVNRLIDIAVNMLKDEGDRARALIDIAEFIRARKR